MVVKLLILVKSEYITNWTSRNALIEEKHRVKLLSTCFQ